MALQTQNNSPDIEGKNRKMSLAAKKCTEMFSSGHCFELEKNIEATRKPSKQIQIKKRTKEAAWRDAREAARLIEADAGERDHGRLERVEAHLWVIHRQQRRKHQKMQNVKYTQQTTR